MRRDRRTQLCDIAPTSKTQQMRLRVHDDDDSMYLTPPNATYPRQLHHSNPMLLMPLYRCFALSLYHFLLFMVPKAILIG
jgi:hypothetical protein